MAAMITELSVGKKSGQEKSSMDPWTQATHPLRCAPATSLLDKVGGSLFATRVTQEESVASDRRGAAPGTCKTRGMHVNVRRLIYDPSQSSA